MKSKIKKIGIAFLLLFAIGLITYLAGSRPKASELETERFLSSFIPQ